MPRMTQEEIDAIISGADLGASSPPQRPAPSPKQPGPRLPYDEIITDYDLQGENYKRKQADLERGQTPERVLSRFDEMTQSIEAPRTASGKRSPIIEGILGAADSVLIDAPKAALDTARNLGGAAAGAAGRAAAAVDGSTQDYGSMGEAVMGRFPLVGSALVAAGESAGAPGLAGAFLPQQVRDNRAVGPAQPGETVESLPLYALRWLGATGNVGAGVLEGTFTGKSISKAVEERQRGNRGFAGLGEDAGLGLLDELGFDRKQDKGLRSVSAWGGWLMGFALDIVVPVAPLVGGVAKAKSVLKVGSAAEKAGVATAGEVAKDTAKAFVAGEFLGGSTVVGGARSSEDIAKSAAEKFAEQHADDAVDALRSQNDAALNGLPAEEWLRPTPSERRAQLRKAKTLPGLSDDAIDSLDDAIEDIVDAPVPASLEAQRAMARVWLEDAAFRHFTLGTTVKWGEVAGSTVPEVYRAEVIRALEPLSDLGRRPPVSGKYKLTDPEQAYLRRWADGGELERAVNSGSLTAQEIENARVIVAAKVAEAMPPPSVMKKEPGFIREFWKDEPRPSDPPPKGEAATGGQRPQTRYDRKTEAPEASQTVFRPFDSARTDDGIDLPRALDDRNARVRQRINEMGYEANVLRTDIARSRGIPVHKVDSYDLLNEVYKGPEGRLELAADTLFRRIGGVDEQDRDIAALLASLTSDDMRGFDEVWDALDSGKKVADALGIPLLALRRAGEDLPQAAAERLRFIASRPAAVLAETGKKGSTEASKHLYDGVGFARKEDASHALLAERFKARIYDEEQKRLQQSARGLLVENPEALKAGAEVSYNGRGRAKAKAALGNLDVSGAPLPTLSGGLTQEAWDRGVARIVNESLTEMLDDPRSWTALYVGAIEDAAVAIEGAKSVGGVSRRVRKLLKEKPLKVPDLRTPEAIKASEFPLWGSSFDELKAEAKRRGLPGPGRGTRVEQTGRLTGNIAVDMEAEAAAAAAFQAAMEESVLKTAVDAIVESMSASGVGAKWLAAQHPEVLHDLGSVLQNLRKVLPRVLEGKPLTKPMGIGGLEMSLNQSIGSTLEKKGLRQKVDQLVRDEASSSRVADQILLGQVSSKEVADRLNDMFTGARTADWYAKQDDMKRGLIDAWTMISGMHHGDVTARAVTDRILGGMVVGYLGMFGGYYGAAAGALVGTRVGLSGIIHGAKAGMLGGVALANPAYHAINFISGPIIIGATQGAKGLRLMKSGFGEAGWLAASVSMYRRGIGYRMDGATVVIERDALGRQWTVEQLSKGANAHGLSSAPATVELGSKVEADFQAYARSRVEQTKRALGGRAPERVEDLVNFLRQMRRTYLAPTKKNGLWGELASAMDETYRMSVVIGALKEGRSEASAFAAGRDALFDYSRLSKFEKEQVSKGIWFWTFRRNTYDYVLTMALTDPNKLGRLIKLESMQPGSLWETAEQETGVPSRFVTSKDYMSFRSVMKLTEEFEKSNNRKLRYAIYGPPMVASAAVQEMFEIAAASQTSDDSFTGGARGIIAISANPVVETMAMVFDKQFTDAGLSTLPGYTDAGMDVLMRRHGLWDHYQQVFGIEAKAPGDVHPNRAMVAGGPGEASELQFYIPDLEDRRNYARFRMLTLLAGLNRNIDYTAKVEEVLAVALGGDRISLDPRFAPENLLPQTLGATVSNADTQFMLDQKANYINANEIKR